MRLRSSSHLPRGRLPRRRTGSARARDWASAKARVAVADFARLNPQQRSLYAVEFSDVVRADLDYSGILDLVSKSMFPLQTPGAPAELNAKAWNDAPASAQLLAFGNFSATGNNVEIQAWLNDVRDNASLPPLIGKVYRGDAATRTCRLAYSRTSSPMEIISKLSGGLPSTLPARR